MQRRQHPEAEQVELHQPGGGAVVLVPLQHRAVLHPPPLDRAHLDHRAVADDHPAGVDAEVPRGVLDLNGQVEHPRGDAVVGLASGGRHVAPPVDALGPRVLLAGSVAERLGHVPHRRPRPVRDHVGHLGGVVAAVLVVDVLDDLLPPVALDVDVDVRRAVPLGRQEALEQQPELHRVGGGDAEGVAHRRVGGRSPALAEDVVAPAELDEVPHDEEVAGEAELLDDRQLAVDRLPGERVSAPLAVAAAGPVLDDAAEVLHLGQPVRTRERRQRRGDERQVEGGRPPHLPRQLDDSRVADEAAGLLGPRPEVGAGGSG